MDYVYVVDMEGKPLMPTKRFGKVRKWLKNKQAKVVRKSPFTIKLLFKPESEVMKDIVLVEDAEHIMAINKETGEILYKTKIKTEDEVEKKEKKKKRPYKKKNRRNSKKKNKKRKEIPSFEERQRAKEIRLCKKLLPIVDNN